MANKKNTCHNNEGFTDDIVENVCLTAGQIIDSYIISQDDVPGNRTEQYLYPYQTPIFLRNLPDPKVDELNFFADEKYVVYLVTKKISSASLAEALGTDTDFKIKFGYVDVDEDELEKRRALFPSDPPELKGRAMPPTLGARYLLPDGVTIDFLVRHGFLMKLERDKKNFIPAVGNPYEDKDFYHHASTISLWPYDSGFEPGAHYPGHIKKFTLVDRFGSDKGSFLCEAQFKTKEAKREICEKLKKASSISLQVG